MFKRSTGRVLLGGLAVVFILAFGNVHAQEGQPGSEDRYIGYYYPAPETREAYGPRVRTMKGADRRRRTAFITGLANQIMSGDGPPPFSIFAKGGESRHLIIVGLTDEAFATIYRIRAWLAALTAMARATPVFNGQTAPPEELTFLDLLRMLGFEDVVISDGRELSHRIDLR